MSTSRQSKNQRVTRQICCLVVHKPEPEKKLKILDLAQTSDILSPLPTFLRVISCKKNSFINQF